MVVWIFYVSLTSKSIIILKPLKTMKQRRLVLALLSLLTLSAFGDDVGFWRRWCAGTGVPPRH